MSIKEFNAGYKMVNGRLVPIDGKPKGKSKINSTSQKIDGYNFRSKEEARFYGSLKIMKMQGIVYDWQYEHEFDLGVSTQKGKRRVHKVDFCVWMDESGLHDDQIRGTFDNCYLLEIKGSQTDYWQRDGPIRRDLIKKEYGYNIHLFENAKSATSFILGQQDE